MKLKRKYKSLLIKIYIVCFAVIFITGCCVPKAGNNIDPQKIAAGLKNSEPKAFKGIGNITLLSHGKIKFKERILWEKTLQNTFNVIIRNIAGISLMNLYWDDSLFYLKMPNQESFSGKPDDDILKDALYIPISPKDIQTLLGGGIFVRPHKKAIMLKDRTLILKNRWGFAVQKIYMELMTMQVKEIRVYGLFGLMSYKVVFLDQNKSFIISDSLGYGLRIDIERIIEN